MVTITAIEPVLNYGVVIGYKLRDSNGKTMDVASDKIIAAIKTNQVTITNLEVTADNKLVLRKNAQNTQNTQPVQPAPQPVQPAPQPVQPAPQPVQPAPQPVQPAPAVDAKKPETSDKASKMKRMNQLVELLNKARYVYEQGVDEIMSNKEYDALYDELNDLENELGVVLNNSPTINVGYEVVSDLPKEKHETVMLSLGKTKEEEDLQRFLKDKSGVLSWKLDGLTVVMTYENGELVKAVTRGNGTTGELVTANALTFINVPRKIKYTGKLVIRGEAIMKYSTFNQVNENGEYKNPRNLCSGSVRQLDSSITAKRSINWIAFTLVSCTDGMPNEFDKQLDWLDSLGFETVERKIVNANNIKSVIAEYEKVVSSGEFDIPTDGLVLTYQDTEYGKKLGVTAKTPRHSIAFKWQDEEADSQMINIEWQVGRTGVITPVAVFEPVDLEGSTVQRASLHNLSILLDLLAQPFVGQKIKVYKANMIIPQISWAEFQENPVHIIPIPGTCPCCGEPTSVHEDKNSGVLTLHCDNPDCGEKGNRLFKHFVTRDAMNIDGISGATLETLSDCGIVTDLASIFHLAEHQDEITNLEGYGFKSFYNMVQAVEKARNVKLANLIYALGIPNIGLATAKLICKYFNNDMESTVTASYDQLINIDGIGDVIAQSFVDYFADKENAEQFVRLLKEVRIQHEEVSTDTSMAGVTICVTGDVYIFPNRRTIKDIVENMGGKLTGSVSRSTNYLVTNDTTSGSRKNKAAQEYGIPILTEQEFIDMFNIQV